MNPDPQVSSKHSLEVFACPSDYSPTRFFTRYCKQYVAPIYHMHLSEIGRTKGTDIIQLWGWTFDRLADKLAIKRDADDFGGYVAQRKDGTIPCASSRVSEVYKSAYLRVLEALWSANLLDDATYRALSTIVCPVDFSFWDIGVIERPGWWPQASTKMEGLESKDEWQRTSELASRDIDGKQLIFAAGPCSAPDDELQSIRFSLVPFGYKVTGSRLPTPERIAELLYRPTWSVDVMQNKRLSFFEVPLSKWESSGQEGIRIGDLLLVPLLARIESTNINCWQYWRGMSPLMFPTAPLARGTVAVGPKEWSLEADSKRVFSGYNWTQGPLQRLRFNFNDAGQFASADPTWLEAALNERGFKLAFVLSHEYRIRKSEYSDHDESTFAKLLHFSSLITA
jgi:hypothetical protein